MNNNQKLIIKARQILIKKLKTNSHITYKEFADLLEFTHSPIITAVTNLLEVLIDKDVAGNRPIISAVVVQKGHLQLPRRGFFEKLHSLKIINLNDASFCDKNWHIEEFIKLKKFYENNK